MSTAKYLLGPNAFNRIGKTKGDISDIKAISMMTFCDFHYNDVIMSEMASYITSLTIVYSTFYSGADQRKHQSSASLAFVWGIHRWPVIPRTNGQ